MWLAVPDLRMTCLYQSEVECWFTTLCFESLSCNCTYMYKAWFSFQPNGMKSAKIVPFNLGWGHLFGLFFIHDHDESEEAILKILLFLIHTRHRIMRINLLKWHTRQKSIQVPSIQVPLITFTMRKFTLRIKFPSITNDFHSHLSSHSRKLSDSLAKVIDGTLWVITWNTQFYIYKIFFANEQYE